MHGLYNIWNVSRARGWVLGCVGGCAGRQQHAQSLDGNVCFGDDGTAGGGVAVYKSGKWSLIRRSTIVCRAWGRGRGVGLRP